HASYCPRSQALGQARGPHPFFAPRKTTSPQGEVALAQAPQNDPASSAGQALPARLRALRYAVAGKREVNACLPTWPYPPSYKERESLPRRAGGPVALAFIVCRAVSYPTPEFPYGRP